MIKTLYAMKMLTLIIAIPAIYLTTVFSPIDRQITGTVRDEAGTPLIGANVVVKETTIGTVTDFDGKFTLMVPSGKKTLIVTYTGFATQEIELSSSDTVNITLSAGVMLEEMTVTGRGIHRVKRELSYAMQAVPDNAPYPSPAHAQAIEQEMKISGLNTRSGSQVRTHQGLSTEDYNIITDNPFHESTVHPLSTFSIDVDRASYSNLRSYILNGRKPPVDAVRIEEMVNYFDYDYPQPRSGPFSIHTEMHPCPWKKDHMVLQIGLQGKRIDSKNLPASNLVFLVDVSGSMQDPDKLPLVISSFKVLVEQLRQQDRIAIVVYAGSSGLVLPSTSGAEKEKITGVLDRLTAGGSTAGAAGIQLAYKVARENFIKNGNNRVILATDGDFNVGVSSDAELVRLIEKERESGIFLTVLGYGVGNYKDNKMQELADHGNGNHAYIDGINEARKVFVNEFGGTLFTIAKDVKIQVEFNPAKVQAYRLIGYENRMLAAEDFNDDKKDAGEIGSGHTVTALYEIIPAGIKNTYAKSVDKLKYQKTTSMERESTSDEWLTIKFRYKEPQGNTSELLEQIVDGSSVAESASDNFNWAAAVAAFGMVLRDSEFKGASTLELARELATESAGKDMHGYRAEFISMIEAMDLLASKD